MIARLSAGVGVLLVALLGVLIGTELRGLDIVPNAVLVKQPVYETTAPGIRVTINQLELHQDKLVVHLPGLRLGQSIGFGSMLPTLGVGHIFAYRVVPHTDIRVGDEVLVRLGTDDDGRILALLHQVIEVGYDCDLCEDRGWYVLTKGTHNQRDDGIRFRAEAILGVTVAVFR